MIKSLRIKNFILVRDLDIEFAPGLNVLTGETGAGKSVMIGALDLILGQKSRPGLFYNNQESIYLETVIDLSKQKSDIISSLQDEGFIETEESELIISREILPDNSSRFYLNGKRVTASVIKEYRDTFVDFHSQREQTKLFSTNYQLDIIDTYGDLMKQRGDYRRTYKEIKSNLKRLRELEQAERQGAEKQRLYEYQIAELEELNLKDQEEKELQKEIDLLTNSEDILHNSQEMQQVFYEQENSLFDQISSYIQRFEKFTENSENIKNVVLSLTNVLQILNDVRTDVNNVRDTIDLDWSRMQDLENRLNEILRIKNKYKMEIPDILEYLSEMKLFVDNYDSYKTEIERLKGDISILADKLKSKAEQLSLDRKDICKHLRKEIINDIYRLAIPDGDFGVVFNDLGRKTEDDILDGFDESGKDRVEFLFSANKGVPLQPLKNAISGGELSRLLLVIKKQLAGRLDTFSLVFDEIDSGIGGKTANHLGEFMAQAGRYHQVLCITHLSQIAAYATKHFLIEKKSSSDKSYIEIKTLTEQKRKEEIARMLAGSKSETALRHAEELLNNK